MLMVIDRTWQVKYGLLMLFFFCCNLADPQDRPARFALLAAALFILAVCGMIIWRRQRSRWLLQDQALRWARLASHISRTL
jgi:hypothetical protein